MELYFEKQNKSTERADHIFSVGSAKKYPCFKLVFNYDWNDYGARTWFHLWYLEDSSSKLSIGDVKIMHKEEDTFDSMPDSFEALDDNYCSLGMKISFYKALLDKFGKNDAKQILGALQDCATNSVVRERFNQKPAFKDSLLRDISAQQVLDDALFLIENEKPDNVFSIGYHFVPPYNTECMADWNVHFDFDAPKYRRVVAVIGENGVGKTQLMAEMLKDLTENKDDAFSHKPLLKNILVLCSSEYDAYNKVKEENNTYKVLRLSVVQDKSTTEKLEDSIKTIINRGTVLLGGDLLRVDQHYMRLLKSQVGEDVDGLIVEEKSDDPYQPPKVYLNQDVLKNLVKNLSTGQLQIFTLVTHICAYIHINSLVVLDEPEIHLHPRLVTEFFVCLGELLSLFGSYAIVPTHSPLVVRECVNGNVYLMNRTKENTVQIGKVPFRTFGQDLTTLYENVFSYQEDKTFFYQVVKEMFGQRKATYNSVVSELEDDGILLDSNSRYVIREIFASKDQMNTKER